MKNQYKIIQHWGICLYYHGAMTLLQQGYSFRFNMRHFSLIYSNPSIASQWWEAFEQPLKRLESYRDLIKEVFYL